MKISQKGVLEIAEHEGIVLGPYLDSVGVWTWGVGHTSAAGHPFPENMAREDTRTWSAGRVKEALKAAVRQFDLDLDSYERRVNEAVHVPLGQHQFDALVSFDFNTGGIKRAILTSRLNKGDEVGAARGFMGWLRPKEIVKRRKAEMQLFATGDYSANGSSISLWDALPDGRIKHRGVIDSRQLAQMMDDAGARRRPVILNPLRWFQKIWKVWT